MGSIGGDQFGRSERPNLVRDTAAVAAGIAACLALWLLLVPWDLSEVDSDGRIIAGGGDDTAPLQGAVLAILLVTSLLGVALVPRFGRIAGLSSFVSWASLWAWRASVARAAGANMWLAGFVVHVVPATVAASALVIGVERGRKKGGS